MSGAPETWASDDGRPPAPPIAPAALLAEAWGLFAPAWPRCLLVYWGAFAAYWLLMNLAVLFLAAINGAVNDPSFTPLLEFARFLGVILVPVWLWLGQGIAFLKVARREPFDPEDLFRGGRSLLTAVLVLSIFAAAVAIPWVAIYGMAEGIFGGADRGSIEEIARKLEAARAEGDPDEMDRLARALLSASAPGLVVGFAVLIAARSRLRPSNFLVLDRDAGVFESLWTSIRLTRGRVGPLLVLNLAQLAINLIGLLPLGLGLLVTLPYTRLVSTVAYNALAAGLPPIERVEEGEDEADPE